MDTQSITISFQNVYKYVTYKYLNNQCENSLYMYWDRTNSDITTLMNHELSIYRQHDYEKIKYNAEWVGKIKECVGWVNGQVINFNIVPYLFY